MRNVIDVLAKNSHDKHLNVFWKYGLSDVTNVRLENNISKAFINVIDSLSDEKKGIILKELFNVDIDCSQVTYKYYLQTKTIKENVEEIPIQNRIMFSFCPSGKTWDTIISGDLIASRNYKKIKEILENRVIEEQPQLNGEEIKESVGEWMDEIRKSIENIHDQGSEPDGWILISEKGQLKYCIILENKLHDLDPFQIKNHREKSLKLKEQDTAPMVYKSYNEIVEVMAEINTFLSDEFIRYLFLLKYIRIERYKTLDLIETWDPEIHDYYLNKCLDYLKSQFGSIQPRDRDKVSYSGSWYIPQIVLCYNNEEMKLWLSVYVFPKQKRAKDYFSYTCPDSFNAKDFPKASKCVLSFHFGHRIIAEKAVIYDEDGREKNTYCCWNEENVPFSTVERYLLFWKNNAELIRTVTSVEEKKDILGRLVEEGFCQQGDIRDALDVFEKKPNSGKYVVPEIGFSFSWDIAEVIELDKKDELQEAIEKKIQTVRTFLKI